MTPEQKREKLIPIYDRLQTDNIGIDPSKIVENKLFVAVTYNYLAGHTTIQDVIKAAVNINILAGGKYTQKVGLIA